MLQLDHCLLWNTPAFSTVDSGLINLIHDRCSCTLFTLSSVSSGACLFYARLEGLQSRRILLCYYLFVHAWLDVSTQAWTSQARTGEWVTYDSL